MFQSVNRSVDGFEFFQVSGGGLFYYEALYRHGFFHPFALEVEIVVVEFMPIVSIGPWHFTLHSARRAKAVTQVDLSEGFEPRSEPEEFEPRTQPLSAGKNYLGLMRM